jgi:hypothetical protein
MRLFKIVLVTLLLAAIVNWVRQGQRFSILESLPLVGGHDPSRYDVAAVVIIVIALWGIARTARGDDESRGGVGYADDDYDD